MPVKPFAVFYQLTEEGKIDERTRITQEQRFLDASLTEQQLIYWTTYELIQFYRLFIKFRIKTFSLRNPIFIDASLKGKEYHFVCQFLPKSALSKLTPTDKPFRLKNTLFVIRPNDQLIKIEPKKTQSEELTDLNPILNTIEEQVKNEVKKFSPVIYTGMID